MSRGDGGDPLGKRALFSDPSGDGRVGPGGRAPRSAAGSATASTSGSAAAAEAGRRVWYSRPAPLPSGPFVIHCPRCGTRSRLGWLALARQLVPSLWWPLRPRSRWMRCPACLDFGWCRVDLAGGRGPSR